MAAFRRCVLAVAGDINSGLTNAWSRELLGELERTSPEALLTQDDVWTVAHQAFPDVPDFGTPLRDHIVDVMEHLSDVIYTDPDVTRHEI
ncbi:MAG: hypothetical protein RL169_1598 [Armatimonadota bacterium]